MKTAALLAVSCLCGAATAYAETDVEALAKKSQNPVEAMVSVPFQNNFNFGMGPDKEMGYNLNIQPVVPLTLSSNWNYIVRPILPILDIPLGGGRRKSGLGDLPLEPFFTPKPQAVPKVEIRKVIYGVLTDDLPDVADVTAKVAAMVRDGSLSVHADNTLAGDPAPNLVKQMRVDYTYKGRRYTKTVDENETLVIPDDASRGPSPRLRPTRQTGGPTPITPGRCRWAAGFPAPCWWANSR